VASFGKKLRKTVKKVGRVVLKGTSIGAPIVGALGLGPVGALAGSAVGAAAALPGSSKDGARAKRLKTAFIAGGASLAGSTALSLIGGGNLSTAPLPALKNILGIGTSAPAAAPTTDGAGPRGPFGVPLPPSDRLPNDSGISPGQQPSSGGFWRGVEQVLGGIFPGGNPPQPSDPNAPAPGDPRAEQRAANGPAGPGEASAFVEPGGLADQVGGFVRSPIGLIALVGAGVFALTRGRR
jgi:hypothetical protein